LTPCLLAARRESARAGRESREEDEHVSRKSGRPRRPVTGL